MATSLECGKAANGGNAMRSEEYNGAESRKSYTSIGHEPSSDCTVRFRTVCLLLFLQAGVFVAASLYIRGWPLMWRPDLSECISCFGEAAERAHQENLRLKEENRQLREKLQDGVNRGMVHPYQVITGSMGHDLPEMYGEVNEKTIWSYWHHPLSCPNSSVCVLPPQVQLCVESVVKNKGSFDHRIVHIDEVEKFVSWMELPVRWKDLKPPHQKDALMNALLARYGGVAIDISTILLRPIDDYWDEMVEKNATFRGYMYRLNGQPWRHAEVTVVWFLMARREGIFSTAVRNQVIGMGDRTNTRSYHHWYLALGDQTLLPILTMFNYSLPKCYEDPTIMKYHKFPDQNPRWCPENESPPWYKGITGPPRTDTTILLRDPRDGPQLPFAFAGSLAWHIDDDRTRWNASLFQPGSPMHGVDCFSAKECWEKVFLHRYHEQSKHGEAKLLSFVKLFHHASELDGKSREELLADQYTYFYNWLKLSGIHLGGKPHKPRKQEKTEEGKEKTAKAKGTFAPPSQDSSVAG